MRILESLIPGLTFVALAVAPIAPENRTATSAEPRSRPATAGRRPATGRRADPAATPDQVLPSRRAPSSSPR